jgi:hypothetical protein
LIKVLPLICSIRCMYETRCHSTWILFACFNIALLFYSLSIYYEDMIQIWAKKIIVWLGLGLVNIFFYIIFNWNYVYFYWLLYILLTWVVETVLKTIYKFFIFLLNFYILLLGLISWRWKRWLKHSLIKISSIWSKMYFTALLINLWSTV